MRKNIGFLMVITIFVLMLSGCQKQAPENSEEEILLTLQESSE